VASNKIRGLAAVPQVIATGLPPPMVAFWIDLFLFRAANLSEGCLHDLGGTRIGVGE
jgi:hypothetical protein